MFYTKPTLKFKYSQVNPELKSETSTSTSELCLSNMPKICATRYRIPDPCATVKVERSSPNKNPFPQVTFPQHDNRLGRSKHAQLPPVLQPAVSPSPFYDSINPRAVHHQHVAQFASVNPAPATDSRLSKAPEQICPQAQERPRSLAKRKAQEITDEPLDLSMSSKKRKDPALNLPVTAPTADNVTTASHRRNNVIVRLPRSLPPPPIPPPLSTTRPPPPYNVLPCPVIVPATSSHSPCSMSGRQRRYRSDEAYHSHWISDVAKHALSRRRSAPDDVRRGNQVGSYA